MRDEIGCIVAFGSDDMAFTFFVAVDALLG